MENREFVLPRSLAGRAILFLFASPLAVCAVSALFNFAETAVSAACRFFMYRAGTLEPARETEFLRVSQYIGKYVGGYIHHLSVLFSRMVFGYFNALFLISMCAFLAWIVVRFRRSGALSGRDWFLAFAAAAALLAGIPILASPISFAFDARPLEGLSEFLLWYVPFALETAAEFFAMIFIARGLFVKTRFAPQAWENEISAGEFFGGNLRAALRLVKSAGSKKIAKIALALFAADLVYWFLLMY